MLRAGGGRMSDQQIVVIYGVKTGNDIIADNDRSATILSDRVPINVKTMTMTGVEYILTGDGD